MTLHRADNNPMHPSGDVGRFQMDNLSSPPGDCGCYPANEMNYSRGPSIRVGQDVANLDPLYLDRKGVPIDDLGPYRIHNRDDIQVHRYLCGGRFSSVLVTISHWDEHPADVNFIHVTADLAVLLPRVRFNPIKNTEAKFLGMLSAFQWIVEEGDDNDRKELFDKYKLPSSGTDTTLSIDFDRSNR